MPPTLALSAVRTPSEDKPPESGLAEDARDRLLVDAGNSALRLLRLSVPPLLV